MKKHNNRSTEAPDAKPASTTSALHPLDDASLANISGGTHSPGAEYVLGGITFTCRLFPCIECGYQKWDCGKCGATICWPKLNQHVASHA
ncbi:MAG: hypothetical protein LBJ95_03055 [Oscillospiraceae bacterium]|jgi:hypothetical protein|nr:hypothetical protein [Oscillospiraceae bacterium]